MRILFVTPFAPSRQRPSPFNHIKRLSRNHAIVLVSLFQSDQEARELKALRPYCEAIYPIHLSQYHSYLNCARLLISPVPLFVGYFHSMELRRTAEQLVARGDYDLLHAQHIRAAGLVADLDTLPKVFDSQDCMTMLMERHYRSGPGPAKVFLYLTEWLKMRRYEPQVCQGFQKITVCSPIDQKTLKTMGPSLDISLLFNGVDLEYFRLSEEERQPCSLVFIGRLSYYPNRDALLYLYRDIFPLVKVRFPAVKLYVVGGGLPSRIEAALRADPSVEVVGHADDVRPYLRQATISVTPMRLGAGTNFKIIEALAMGIPVVTTSQGCEGLAVIPERDLVQVDNPTELAQRVCELLADAKRRRQLAVNGRRYVEMHHDWEIIVRQLETIYVDVVGGAQ